jgi:transcriptional regulator with XRE-family HTH domain
MPNRVTLSEQIADRVRDLRNRAGLSREQLAESARAHGAAEDFTHQSVAFLENGRRQDGVRTRLFSLDEMWALAEALEVTPLELLGGDAPLFVGDTHQVSVECPRCKAEAGGMERATRQDLEGLGELSTLELTLVEAAYRLAEAIDAAEDARALPALTKELRACVEQLSAGRRRQEKPDEDDFGDLDDPE